MAEGIASGIFAVAKVVSLGFQGYHDQKHRLPEFHQLVMAAAEELIDFEADYDDIRHFNALRMYGIYIYKTDLDRIDNFLSEYQKFLEDCKASLNLSRLDRVIGLAWGPGTQIQRQSLESRMHKLRSFHSDIKSKLEPHGRARESTLDRLSLARPARIHYGDSKRSATMMGNENQVRRVEPLIISFGGDQEDDPPPTQVRLKRSSSEPALSSYKSN